jgi:hypothetical protein
MKRYARTQAELAAMLPKRDPATGEIEHGISLTALKTNWLKKPGNPGKTTAKGYDLEAWRSFVGAQIQANRQVDLDGLKSVLRAKQAKRIRTRTAGTRGRRKRAQKRLDKLLINHPRRAALALILKPLPGLIEDNAKLSTDLLPTFAEPTSEAQAKDVEDYPQVAALYSANRSAAARFQSLPGILREVCSEVLEDITHE